MNISELYQMQKELDERIIREKGLEGVDLLPNTVLALQVEIAELANEWRGFKHWSNNREPRTVEYMDCFTCNGTGIVVNEAWKDEHCSNCQGKGRVPSGRNPLLEEYVDCLHFFLSIAQQLDLPADDLYVPEVDLDSETSVLFTELLHSVGMLVGHMFLFKKPEDFRKSQRNFFRAALGLFYDLGEQRLGFTWDQIAEAYVKKNRINHERQANGY